MNPKLLRLNQSPTLYMADLARKIERQGNKVIKLQTGDPDFATPTPIVEAAYQALHDEWTHYVDSRGLPSLRRAIADKLDNENGLSYDSSDEILVTHGGIHAVYITINALIEPGDEVLIISPAWMPYVSITQIAGGTPVEVCTDPKTDFKVDVDKIKSKLNSKTKILILNSPCNPTGRVLGEDDLKKIAKIARENNIFIISDEVYEKIIYVEKPYLSFASLEGMRDRTVTVNSFSKTYAMTGWRIGYLATKKELLDQILKVSQYSITNVAPFIQKAAIVALREPSVSQLVDTMFATYTKRRETIARELAKINNIHVVIPEGAFYFMIDISNYYRDSKKFAGRLLNEKLVSVVPGIGFGECSEGFIRITFAAPEAEIVEGISRLDSFLRKEVNN